MVCTSQPPNQVLRTTIISTSVEDIQKQWENSAEGVKALKEKEGLNLKVLEQDLEVLKGQVSWAERKMKGDWDEKIHENKAFYRFKHTNTNTTKVSIVEVPKVAGGSSRSRDNPGSSNAPLGHGSDALAAIKANFVELNLSRDPIFAFIKAKEEEIKQTEAEIEETKTRIKAVLD